MPQPTHMTDATLRDARLKPSRYNHLPNLPYLPHSTHPTY